MQQSATQRFGALRTSLATLRRDLPVLSARATGQPVARSEWLDRLERNLLPALDFAVPVLVVAVCGGGSTGKSTLFNLLAGQTLSQTAFRAGLTRRILMAAHPDVLADSRAAAALLHRLEAPPVAWRQAEDATQPGPPLFAPTPSVPRHLVLVDTPDFDTGEDGALANRARALPILRTAEVLIYVFTNAVYNNRSNTQFMADLVGGVGGRPTILVYRLSRAAPDPEAEAHCQHVARQLFPGAKELDGWPRQIVGVYRVHESDAVALGQRAPALLPLATITAGRPIQQLLAELDVADIKRQVLADDLQRVATEAQRDLAAAQRQAEAAALFRLGLERLLTIQALQALQAFPAEEALSLTARLFTATSPLHVRALRGVGRAMATPLRAARGLARRWEQWRGTSAPEEVPLPERIAQDLLSAANALRNALLDDWLIVPVAPGDELVAQARAHAQTLTRKQQQAPVPQVEPVSRRLVNVHIPLPQALAPARAALLAQDWPAIAQELVGAAEELVGLPDTIEQELRQAVYTFRANMSWLQAVRETFFASLGAIPPLLGVTYTLLTADPVTGGGIAFQLEGVLGLNDLWALVSIPAAAGLSKQDQRQLQVMLAPIFALWLAKRSSELTKTLSALICQPVVELLGQIPAPDDPRFATVSQALATLEDQA
jgi:hypothetical protein